MYDMAIRIAIYIGVGFICWGLSTRFPMAQYRQSGVTRFDWFCLFLGLTLATAFGIFLSPYLLAGMGYAQSIFQPLRFYFAQSSTWVQVLAYVGVADFLAYWAHRALHNAGLWRFHAFHHAPTSLNWLAGMRGTPLHFIFTLTPGTVAASLFLFTDSPVMLVTLVVIDAFNQHLLHSNISVPFAKQIEYLLVTPRMHFVHHHPDPQYGNTNYGFLFSIWDQLFGTYVDADEVNAKGLLGIDYELDNVSLFLGLNPPHLPLEQQTPR